MFNSVKIPDLKLSFISPKIRIIPKFIVISTINYQINDLRMTWYSLIDIPDVLLDTSDLVDPSVNAGISNPSTTVTPNKILKI